MQKFLYVFAETDKDALIAAGYFLLKSDEANNVYVFENQERECFELDKSEHLFSDTLTF